MTEVKLTGSSKLWDRIADVFFGKLEADEALGGFIRWLVSLAGVGTYVVGFGLLLNGVEAGTSATERRISFLDAAPVVLASVFLLAMAYCAGLAFLLS